MKTCVYCNEVKSLTDFPKHISYKDKLDRRCRNCIKKHASIRKELHKIAPPRPEVCDCCGCVPHKWCLDHDHTNNFIRGWICDRCNTGMGKLGDNLEGVRKAVQYLEQAESTKKAKSNDLACCL